ncbi:MAG: tellurite resistance/C4-dicarboxylate transporter family protein [Thermoleophilia bacterium]|nr:tellurite resistance/C4-dicarboxylate transporter family protein [Thermoleophilia bacterium]
MRSSGTLGEAASSGYLRHLFDRGVRPLFPGYFNLVMATGIVSNALFIIGPRPLSSALLVVNLAAFAVLVLATTLRAGIYRRELWSDLTNPRLVFTFFTIVAGANVLGSGLYVRGFELVAAGLWLFALVVWVLLGYFSFAVLTFINTESGAEVVHGGWLIAIVGTESLVVLGALVAPEFGPLAALTWVAVYALWGVGIVFYGIFVTLFTHRIFFLRVTAEDMNPLFWVVMGAAAIATNAGSTLIVSEPDLEFLLAMRPFIDGTTLILWAWATWWIPLLVIFGFWRHVVQRYQLSYHPAYWNLVFPLGMYTVATYRLSLASDYTALQTVSRVMVWVSFAAWLLTMLGLIGSVRGTLSAAKAS